MSFCSFKHQLYLKKIWISCRENCINVLMISEIKISDSFSISNFVIDGFSRPYELGRNSNGGRILISIRQDIPSCIIATEKESKAFT